MTAQVLMGPERVGLILMMMVFACVGALLRMNAAHTTVSIGKRNNALRTRIDSVSDEKADK